MNDEEQQAAIEALGKPWKRSNRSSTVWSTTPSLGDVRSYAVHLHSQTRVLAFDADFFTTMLQPIPLGVVLGLLLGKPSALHSRRGWRCAAAGLPAGRDHLAHIHGAGWLGGIGFTMSIFVAGLAFKE